MGGNKPTYIAPVAAVVVGVATVVASPSPALLHAGAEELCRVEVAERAHPRDERVSRHEGVRQYGELDIHPLVHSLVHAFIHAFIYWFVRWFSRSARNEEQ